MGVAVSVGVSAGISVGVDVAVGVLVDMRVVVGRAVGVVLGVSVGVAEGNGVGVFAGVALVLTSGGNGVSLTSVPRSLIENCRSTILVSAKLRAAKSLVLPLTEMVAPLGFSMRTYSVSFALHERDVPLPSVPSNTIAPSTPTCRLTVSVTWISRSITTVGTPVRRGVAPVVGVGLPGKVGNGNTVDAIVGMAVGCAPGIGVAVRVGGMRVGVTIGCNCAMNDPAEIARNNPPVRQTRKIIATIAAMTGSDGGRRVKCASENRPG